MTITAISLTGTAGTSLDGAVWDVAGTADASFTADGSGAATMNTGSLANYGGRVNVRTDATFNGGEARFRIRVGEKGENKIAVSAGAGGGLPVYTSTPVDGYRVELNLFYSELTFGKLVNEAYTQLGILDFADATFAAGTEWDVAIRFASTGVQAWFWAAGTTRPTAPTFDTTDKTYTGGKIGCGMAGGPAASQTFKLLFVEHDDLVAAGVNAGPDQNIADNDPVTLVGTPPGGVWTQDSGTAVTLSAPVTNATDTRVTFTADNPSTSVPLDLVFRYTGPTA